MRSRVRFPLNFTVFFTIHFPGVWRIPQPNYVSCRNVVCSCTHLESRHCIFPEVLILRTHSRPGLLNLSCAARNLGKIWPVPRKYEFQYTEWRINRHKHNYTYRILPACLSIHHTQQKMLVVIENIKYVTDNLVSVSLFLLHSCDMNW